MNPLQKPPLTKEQWEEENREFINEYNDRIDREGTTLTPIFEVPDEEKSI